MLIKICVAFELPESSSVLHIGLYNMYSIFHHLPRAADKLNLYAMFPLVTHERVHALFIQGTSSFPVYCYDSNVSLFIHIVCVQCAQIFYELTPAQKKLWNKCYKIYLLLHSHHSSEWGKKLSYLLLSKSLAGQGRSFRICSLNWDVSFFCMFSSNAFWIVWNMVSCFVMSRRKWWQCYISCGRRCSAFHCRPSVMISI